MNSIEGNCWQAAPDETQRNRERSSTNCPPSNCRWINCGDIEWVLADSAWYALGQHHTIRGKGAP